MRILITRPPDEAQRTANALRSLGHEALIAPVLHIEAVSDAAIGEGPFSAVLMTSGNAARALLSHERRLRIVHLPVFAVGRQTAVASRQAGFSDVISADGDGADLVRLVSARLKDRSQPLLYLAGSDRARDLAGDLAAGGLKVETVVLYHATAAPGFTADIKDALSGGGVDGALHFSRRSTAIFVDCARAGGLLRQIKALTHFCLSDRAAEPLRDAGVGNIRVSAQPDEAALIDLLPRS